MGTKEEIAELERTVGEKQAAVAAVTAQAETATGTRDERARVLGITQVSLAAKKAETASMKDQAARLRDSLAKVQEERAAAEAKQRDAQELLDSEKVGLESAKSLQVQITEERASQELARRKLDNMFSETARNEATEAARNELTAAAAAPTAGGASAGAAPSGLLQRFKLAARMAQTGFAIKEASEEEIKLRPARKDLATLLSLHRLLDKYVHDGNEGLRQWGFAQVALVNTKEMHMELIQKLADTGEDKAKMTAERGDLSRDLAKIHSSLRSFQSVHGRLEAKYQGIISAVPACEEALSALEEQRSSLKSSLMQKTRLRERTAFELEKDRESLLEVSAALEQHPAEAVRRANAARGLVEQSEALLAKSQREIDRTQKELGSFKQVHMVLLSAQGGIAQDLEEQRARHAELMAQYCSHNHELSAMATSYVEPFPGPGGFRASSNPASPRDSNPSSPAIGAGAKLVLGMT